MNIDFSEHKHWVDKYLWAKEKVKEYKAIMEEAYEEILGLAGGEFFDNESTLTVDGRPVLSRVRSVRNTFTVGDVRERYPEIAAELEREKTTWLTKTAQD